MNTLEKVEALRTKANLTYEEAKNVLNEANGDLLDAIVILERQGKIGKPAATASIDEGKNMNTAEETPNAAKETARSSDEEVAPVVEAVTSSDQEEVPTAKVDPSSDEVEVTATESESSPDEEEVSATETEISSDTEKVTAAEMKISSDAEKVTASEMEIPTSSDEETTPAVEAGISSDAEKVPAAEAEISSDQDKIPAVEAEIPAPSDEDNTPADENASSAGPDAAATGENASSIPVSAAVGTEKKNHSGKKVRKTMEKIWNVLKSNSFHITWKGSSLITLPVWAFALIILFTWKWMIPIMLISLFFQVRYSFDGKDDLSKANDFMDKVGNMASDVANEFSHNK